MHYTHLDSYYLHGLGLEWRGISTKILQATMLGKVFTSIYCLFVAFFFIQSNMIGGGILQSYTAILVEMGSSSGDRLSSYADSPTILGGPVQTIFHLFILVFQLAVVWTKKK